MPLDEGPDSAVTEVTIPEKTLGSSIKKVVFTDDRCHKAAVGLTEYWRRNPDKTITAVRYDVAKKLFVIKHRVDGEFTVTPERFFSLIAEKTCELLIAEVNSLSQKVLGSPNDGKAA